MNKTSEEFPSREDVLNLLIDQTFGPLPPKTIEASCRRYDESITEMFEITARRKHSALVSGIYQDIEIGPVAFPAEIHMILKKKDVFLMTLGRSGDSWTPVWMSPLYSVVSA